jgi:hypothetical protein
MLRVTHHYQTNQMVWIAETEAVRLFPFFRGAPFAARATNTPLTIPLVYKRFSAHSEANPPKILKQA